MKPVKNFGRRGDGSMNADTVAAGIVGMGLMGMSISACLLAAGDTVAAVEPIAPGDGAPSTESFPYSRA
jgi:hypothetical protein